MSELPGQYWLNKEISPESHVKFQISTPYSFKLKCSQDIVDGQTEMDGRTKLKEKGVAHL